MIFCIAGFAKASLEQPFDSLLRMLFTSTSIRPNRDAAVSTTFEAVRGSPMSPSTSATLASAGNGFALVMFREFATTLYPRFRNASTSPAPIPREAPVTIAVFAVFAICNPLYHSIHRERPVYAFALLTALSKPQIASVVGRISDGMVGILLQIPS
jgi:hypothetical protein